MAVAETQLAEAQRDGAEAGVELGVTAAETSQETRLEEASQTMGAAPAPGRLMAAVAQNPSKIGLGIDEDTAIVVDRGGVFRVMGTGAVYVVDGSGITH